MGNFFLVLTIISESMAVVCMKLSSGFQNIFYTIVAIVCYGLSFVFLTLTLKSLSTGVANGIWAGASAVLVSVLGILIFKEKLTTIQIISLLLIVIGLLGLNWKSSAL